MIAAQDLSGKMLVSSSDGKVLGTIRECVCLLSTGEILGLVIDASARLLGERAIAGKDIAVIGSDAVLVEDESKLVEPKDVPRLEDYMRPAEAEPLAVLATSGKRLGTVGRILIDEKEQRVVSYEVTGGALRDLADGPRLMPVVPGVVHGEDSILVPSDAAAKMQAMTTGLSSVWGKVSGGVAKLTRRLHEEQAPPASAKAEAAAARPAAKPRAQKAAKPTAAKPAKAAKKRAAKPAKKPGAGDD